MLFNGGAGRGAKLLCGDASVIGRARGRAEGDAGAPFAGCLLGRRAGRAQDAMVAGRGSGSWQDEVAWKKPRFDLYRSLISDDSRCENMSLSMISGLAPRASVTGIAIIVTATNDTRGTAVCSGLWHETRVVTSGA